MNVIVRTNDESLVSSFLKELPPKGITISLEERLHKGVIDASNVVTHAISAAMSVPTSLFVNWLWNKLKGADKSKTNIIINNNSVDIQWTSISQTFHTEDKLKNNENIDQGGRD